tara:strand:+ start:2520 stop:3194 length:675 start_codon:yes stop_codon:yes gene_type:complete
MNKSALFKKQIDYCFKGFAPWDKVTWTKKKEDWCYFLQYCISNPNPIFQDKLKKAFNTLFKLPDLLEDEIIISFNSNREVITNYRLILDYFENYYSFPLSKILQWDGYNLQPINKTNNKEEKLFKYLDESGNYQNFNKSVTMQNLTPDFIQQAIKNNSTSHNLHIGEIQAELLLKPSDLLSDFLNYLDNGKSKDVHEVKRVSLALETELKNRTMIVGAFVNDIV